MFITNQAVLFSINIVFVKYYVIAFVCLRQTAIEMRKLRKA